MTATLQMLVDFEVGLFAWCPRCGWRDVLDNSTLCGVLGGAFPIPATAGAILCPRCGRIGPEVQPDWPSPGVITRH